MPVHNSNNTFPIDTEDIPEVTAHFARKQFGSSPDGWYMYIICPFCGEDHYHGGGNGPGDSEVYGYRIAHCSGPGSKTIRQYKLVPEK